MGNKSGDLVTKIFLWMLEMLLKWAAKIKFSREGLWTHSVEVKIRPVTKSFRAITDQCSRWGPKQPGSSFVLIFNLCPMKIARGHAHNK